MNKPTEISFRKTAPGVYRVTYNNVVLGDSPGYSKDDARTEAIRIVNEAKERALVAGVPSDRVYRPGF
jgi:hypothetical protein